jgi:DNA modification methylase
MSYKSVWDFGRSGGVTNYSVHSIGEYPSKIRPLVFHEIVKRFSKQGDIVLDPFCGCGTMAVEAKILGRHSINYDINENAINLTKEKLSKLTKEEIKNAYNYFINELIKEKELEETKKLRKVQIDKEVLRYEKLMEEIIDFETNHISGVKDARIDDYLEDIKKIDSKKEFVDSIITDIPYASMIKYSDLENDLSTIEDYDKFLEELAKSFEKMIASLKKDGYCTIFVADYRIGASRKILPLHTDVTNIMRDLGMTLFDTFIWRYYRSGGFRPFGKRPFQAMNVHTYILVFHKPDGEELNKSNREVRYRKRLIEKLNDNGNSKEHA